MFGNFGWLNPLGGSCLAASQQYGAVAYTYEPKDGLGHVGDCYAMNAGGNGLWIYYYTDFPLVLIRNGAVEAHWQIPVHGADPFAISGGYALFRGVYENPDHYHLIELTQPSARVKLRIRLRNRQGDPIKAERVAGRGEALFLLRNHEIFKHTVEDAMQFGQ